MNRHSIFAAVATAMVVVLLLVGQPVTTFASEMGAGEQPVMMTSNLQQPIPVVQVTPVPLTDVTLEQGLKQRCSTIYYGGVRKVICSAVFPNITPPPPPPPPPPPTRDCRWTEDNPKCWGV